MFAKAVLRTPSTTRSSCQRFVVSSVLLDRLHLWNQSGDIHSLWSFLQDDLKISKPCREAPLGSSCKSCALLWDREGRYSNALQTLSSQGVAGHDDDSVYQDLLNRHPSSACPDTCDMSPNSLTVWS